MSKKRGKFQKKSGGEKKSVSAGKRIWIWIVTAVVLVAVGITIALANMELDVPHEATIHNTEQQSASETEDNAKIENTEDFSINLGEGLSITEIGSYNGIYMEDGTDEVLSRILMIVLTNNSEKPLQYTEITMTCDAGEAKFSASTVPAGESVVLLEQNRMEYTSGMRFTGAVAQYAVFFDEDLSLCEDKLKIQNLNGAMNVTNISEEDITGDVTIYYKNTSTDMLYGGITYRVTISGGIKAGAIRQITASHFTENGSRIMFVDCE